MNTTPSIRTLEPKPSISAGNFPFSHVLRGNFVSCSKSALAEAAAHYPDPFNDTVDLLDDNGWRLLIYTSRPHWARLCDASFDPRIELIQSANNGAVEIPAEWIGNDPELSAAGIREDLMEANVDVVRAAFLILAFVQSLQLSISEIASIRWWESHVWRAALQGVLLCPDSFCRKPHSLRPPIFRRK